MSAASAALARRTATSVVFTAFALVGWFVRISRVCGARHQCRAQFLSPRLFVAHDGENILRTALPRAGADRQGRRHRTGCPRSVQLGEVEARKRSGGFGRLDATSLTA